MADKKLIGILKRRRGVSTLNRHRENSPDHIPDLKEADLARADLVGANLERADLRGVDLRGANLTVANLRGAQLCKAKLSNADLRGADLRDADLSEASLFGAHLLSTDMENAKLVRADFTWADLRFSDLRHAEIIGARFERATLTGADLEGAEISGSLFGQTAFCAIDLSTVHGLRQTHHTWPSTLGVDSILKSGGKIPSDFLRACGCDSLIQMMVAGDTPIKTSAMFEWISTHQNPLSRCFISYTTEDKAFADRLQRALNQNGVDYWYAPEHGLWGEELHTQSEIQIALRDRMLLLCSAASLRKDWVQYEIERAITQERQCNFRVIVPIMIDDALLTWNHPRATQIREVLAVDFCGATEGYEFEQRLPRLLQALGYTARERPKRKARK